MKKYHYTCYAGDENDVCRLLNRHPEWNIVAISQVTSDVWGDEGTVVGQQQGFQVFYWLDHEVIFD